MSASSRRQARGAALAPHRTLTRSLTPPPSPPLIHRPRLSSFVANYDHIEELVKTRFPVLQQNLITWPAYELACRPAGMETLAVVTYEQMRAGTVDVLMGFEQFGHFLILASQRAVAAANAIRNPNASAETQPDNPNLSILTAVSGYTAVPNADGTTSLAKPDGANMKDWRAPEPAAGDMEVFLQQDKAEELAQQREAQKFEDSAKGGKRTKSPKKAGSKTKKSASKAAAKRRSVKSPSTPLPSPAKKAVSLENDHNTFTDEDAAIAAAAGLAMMGGAAARQAHKDAAARRAKAAGGAVEGRKRGETRRPSEVARSAKAGGKRTRNRRASSKALDIARAAAQSMGAVPSDPNHVPPAAASAPPGKNTSGATPAALAAMEKMRKAMSATDSAVAPTRPRRAGRRGSAMGGGMTAALLSTASSAALKDIQMKRLARARAAAGEGSLGAAYGGANMGLDMNFSNDPVDERPHDPRSPRLRELAATLGQRAVIVAETRGIFETQVLEVEGKYHTQDIAFKSQMLELEAQRLAADNEDVDEMEERNVAMRTELDALYALRESLRAVHEKECVGIKDRGHDAMNSVTAYFEVELQNVRATFIESLESAMEPGEREAMHLHKELDGESKVQLRVRLELLTKHKAQEKAIAAVTMRVAKQAHDARIFEGRLAALRREETALTSTARALFTHVEALEAKGRRTDRARRLLVRALSALAVDEPALAEAETESAWWKRRAAKLEAHLPAHRRPAVDSTGHLSPTSRSPRGPATSAARSGTPSMRSEAQPQYLEFAPRR